jgi:hypothetical protein
MANENLIAVLHEKVEQRKGVLDKIHNRNDSNTDNYTSNELKRCALLIKQIKSYNNQIVEYLRDDNEKLLRKSNGLHKKVKKMIREHNRAGAKLLFNRVEEIEAKRQVFNTAILTITQSKEY